MYSRARYFATDRLRLGRLEADEVPLTERQPRGASWSEEFLVDVSSSTDFSHDDRGDLEEENPPKQQERKSGQRAQSPSSAATRMEEDGVHAFSTTRGLSPLPRLHKCSSMSLVQLSIIVVALAVAVVVTLGFTLRDKGKGGPDVTVDYRFSGFKVHRAAVNDSATAVTGGNLRATLPSGQLHDQSGGDRKKKGEGSSRFIFHNDDAHRRPAHESMEALPRSSTSGGVIWWNEDGFGPGWFPLPSLQPALNRHDKEGRQGSSGEVQGKKASTANTGTSAVSSTFSDEEEEFNEFEKRERRLQRVDRKTYLKNVDLRLLQT